eukprot:scaffold201055_cov29-Tisochrysis_lutea.AAC.7
MARNRAAAAGWHSATAPRAVVSARIALRGARADHPNRPPEPPVAQASRADAGVGPSRAERSRMPEIRESMPFTWFSSISILIAVTP